MTMGTITASLQTLKVENGTGGYTDADIVGRSSSGDPNEFHLHSLMQKNI